MIKIDKAVGTVTIVLSIEDVKRSISYNKNKFKEVRELTNDQYMNILSNYAPKAAGIGLTLNVIGDCQELFGKSLLEEEN